MVRIKVEVVRDAEWDDIYTYTQGDHEYKERMANAIWKVRRVTEHEDKIKKERSIKFIDKPIEVVAKINKVTMCQAVNMNDKPCQYKAVCGKFCKRHKVEVGSVFGKDAPLSKLKMLVEED